jgi:hypothetical protein
MPSLDIFRSDAFSVTQLTDAILKAPYKPGRIGALGLFRERGIPTTTAIVEEKDGRLSLIQTTPRGAPASTIGSQKRTARSFVVPHLVRETTILADEVQNVRSFGSESETDTVTGIVAERLQDLRAMHEVTLEHMRAGAVQGLVKDADGSTLLNLFTAFNVNQQTAEVTPNASSDGGDALRAEVVAIQRLIEAELGAEPVSGYRAFAGKDFFDALRSDLGVTQTLRYADPRSLLEQQANARQFTFGGVTWEEYRGSTGGTPFFADDEAFVFPEGANIFATYFAPADFVETVNTIGLPMYAKQALDMEFGRFVKLHTQSNPLAILLRPRAVVKVTIGT